MDSILGRMVVDQGLATPEEVESCLSKRQDSVETDAPGQGSLAAMLVSQGIVTEKQLQRLRPRVEEEREQKSQTQQIPGFQILRKLGQGAMATVYLARQVSLDRLVAIKVLPKKFTNNEEFVKRFYAEGRAAAKLNHSNIVQAYDVGQAGEYHYFVMEYVEGKTVYDDIEDGRRYKEDRALQITIEVARAMDHAHKAGFIHRDVKPKNIMLTKDGTAKLADMGLARAVSDREAAESEQGKAFGTPYYIAPEQIRGERDVDFRCDIYSLGATLYHMVTGRVPFDGPNPSAVMHQHLKADLVPPDHLNPKLSAGLSEIVEVCMAKDRRKRYTTTADLLQDLELVARGEAPLQARKRFDLASLAAIEETAGNDEPGQTNQTMTAQPSPAPPLTQQPVFWMAAVSGWVVAVIMFILFLLK